VSIWCETTSDWQTDKPSLKRPFTSHRDVSFAHERAVEEELVHMVRVLMIVIGAAVTFAAPAAAGEQEYLKPLREQFVYLSEEQLLWEGHRVCQMVDSGSTSADAVAMVRNDLGISIGAAGEVVSAAVVDLC
jgi:Protein of unknown function (DUF732)